MIYDFVNGGDIRGGLMPTPGSLDLMQAPQAAATPQAPSLRDRFASVLRAVGNQFGTDGLFAQIVSGPNDPRVSAQANAEAKRQALMRAGLATIAASGQGAGTLPALAQGAFAGQQVAGQVKSAAVAQARAANLMAMIQQGGGVDLPVLRQLFGVAIASGDIEGAKALAEVLKVMENQQQPKSAGYGAADEGINPATGKVEKYVIDKEGHVKWLGIAAPPKASSSLQSSVQDQRVFAREQQLSNQYFQQMKDYDVIAKAYGTIQTAASKPDAVGDMALIFAYMKLLDPGSTVREGEYATAQNAGSIPERIWSKYNAAVNGKKLESTRQDFLNRALSIATDKRSAAKNLMNHFSRRAKAWGVDPSAVIYDPFEAYPETAGGNGAGSSNDPFAGLPARKH